MSKISNALVKEVEMMVQNLQVVHAQADTDIVVLYGWGGPRENVLAYVPVTALDDHFERRTRFRGAHANMIVDRNLEVFTRIVSAKFERGEYQAFSKMGAMYPRVDVTYNDLRGETLIDPKATAALGWQ